MRVGLVVGGFPADDSYLRILADTGLELVVYGTGSNLPYEPKIPDYCSVREFDPVRFFNRSHLWWAFPGLARALSQDRIEVSHVISEAWGMRAMQTARWARQHANAVLAIHGCETLWAQGSLPERKIRLLAARNVLTRADGFAGENPRVINQAQTYGLKKHAVTQLIHTNPRDPEVFRPARDQEEKRRARLDLGLPADGVGVGFLGRLTAEKGIEDLLAALSVRQLEADAWVAIAGAGPLHDVVAERAGKQNDFFLGSLEYSKVSTFMRAIDVLVVPSRTTETGEEQGPRALIEAMLAGCIIVGTDCGAIPEMMGSDGVLVRQKDPLSLAEGLRIGIASASDNSVRNRVRKKAIGDYSSATVASTLVSFWEDCLRARDVKPR